MARRCTSRGFTRQYADSTTGLDYYNARYYDPLVGQFVSADSVQGNLGGMDPYAYVEGNPETWTDPSGLMVDPILGGGGGEGGFGGDGLGGDIGGGEVGSGGKNTAPLSVTFPTADGLTSSLNPDDSVTLVTPESDGTSLEQTFEPGEPGYVQALQQVINQQVGNSPSELTLTEEEDTGSDRAALEAAARDETSPTQTVTLLRETNYTNSPEDLFKLAQETQRSGNTRKLRISGAATNVLGEDGLPLTVNHASGGQGTGAQPVTTDEWSWIPETGLKGGTCGGSMMCWRIAQSIATGTATLPEGPINIVEAQEKGFAACDECQINTQRLATALNREIWLFTLNSERNLRSPLIFNP